MQKAVKQECPLIASLAFGKPRTEIHAFQLFLRKLWLDFSQEGGDGDNSFTHRLKGTGSGGSLSDLYYHSKVTLVFVSYQASYRQKEKAGEGEGEGEGDGKKGGQDLQ